MSLPADEHLVYAIAITVYDFKAHALTDERGAFVGGLTKLRHDIRGESFAALHERRRQRRFTQQRRELGHGKATVHQQRIVVPAHGLPCIPKLLVISLDYHGLGV